MTKVGRKLPVKMPNEPAGIDAPLPSGGSERRSGAVADLWLGLQVRSLRKAKGLSLKQLSERADLSIGMVSQIERGIASPSIRSLRQVADALGAPMAWFFHDVAPPAQDEIDKIVRRPARRLLRLSTSGVTKELLTPDFAGAIELLMVTIEPGGSSGPEPYTHKGEDAGYVVAGALELWIGDRCHILNEGDSFRFPSNIPHRFANAADRQTQVLWVVTPPLY